MSHQKTRTELDKEWLIKFDRQIFIIKRLQFHLKLLFVFFVLEFVFMFVFIAILFSK